MKIFRRLHHLTCPCGKVAEPKHAPSVITYMNFDDINTLEFGQPVTWTSRFDAPFTGWVDEVAPGRHVSIFNGIGPWRFGPEHFAMEGARLDVEAVDA